MNPDAAAPKRRKETPKRAGRSGEHKDWATIGGGQLVGWGLPVIAMIGAGAVELREVVWPVALAWMGVACLANARRCGRQIR